MSWGWPLHAENLGAGCASWKYAWGCDAPREMACDQVGCNDKRGNVGTLRNDPQCGRATLMAVADCDATQINTTATTHNAGKQSLTAMQQIIKKRGSNNVSDTVRGPGTTICVAVGVEGGSGRRETDSNANITETGLLQEAVVRPHTCTNAKLATLKKTLSKKLGVCKNH